MGYKSSAPIRSMFPSEPWTDAVRRACERWAEFVQKRAAEYTPVAKAPEGQGSSAFSAQRGRPPGTMKASWVTTPVVPSGNGFEVSAGSTDPIAVHVEYGVMPRRIVPRADRAAASVVATGKPRGTVAEGTARLRFYVGGRAVYAREVNWPGFEGRFMLHKACADSIPALEQFLREEIERAVEDRRLTHA